MQLSLSSLSPLLSPLLSLSLSVLCFSNLAAFLARLMARLSLICPPQNTASRLATTTVEAVAIHEGRTRESAALQL